MSAWQQRVGSSDAYPTPTWISEKRAALKSDADWSEKSALPAIASYLGPAAKTELLAVLSDPNSSGPAASTATRALMASCDAETITEVALVGIRSSTPLRNRLIVLAAFSDAGDPRTLALAKDLLGIAGKQIASAQTAEEKNSALGFTKMVLAKLGEYPTAEARDGLFRFVSDSRLPDGVRIQAMLFLAGRRDLTERQQTYVREVCEGKNLHCPPEVLVFVAAKLVYWQRPAEHSELFLRVLGKNLEALPANYKLNEVCEALEAAGGPESLGFLRRLAGEPKFLDAAQAVVSLGRSGAGSEVSFLFALAADSKIPLQTRTQAGRIAILCEAEQNNFILPADTLESYRTLLQDKSIHLQVRAAMADGLMSAYTIRTERALSDGDIETSQLELELLSQIKVDEQTVPSDLLLAREVRLNVPGSKQRAVNYILDTGMPADGRAGVFRGLAAVEVERAARLLEDLAAQQNSTDLDFCPFLVAVERSDATTFIPALERIAARNCAVPSADQFKAVDLIARGAPREAAEAMLRLAEDGAISFVIRTRALTRLSLIDRALAAPVAESFAGSDLWVLKEAGDVALAACGNPAAVERAAARFSFLVQGKDMQEPLASIGVSTYARALASSGRSEAWKALEPFLSPSPLVRSSAAKQGIEDALRAPASRELVLSALTSHAEVSRNESLTAYAHALARCADLNINHPLRYSPASVVKIVAARENVDLLAGPITLFITAAGDTKGAFYQAGASLDQLYSKGSGTVLLYEVGSEVELDSAIEEAGQFAQGVATRPVQSLFLLMHGSKLRAALGPGDPRRGASLDVTKELDVTDIRRLARHQSLLVEGGTLFWLACSAAEPGDAKHSENLLNASREAFPQLRIDGVIAPEVPLDFHFLKILFDAQGNPIDMDTGGRKSRAQLNDEVPQWSELGARGFA